MEDPGNPDDRTAAQKLAFARFKREIYHKVFRIIFETLLRPSNYGEAVNCSDALTRVLWPGVLIDSVDYQEAEILCAIRAALADFPCPKCLVYKLDLHLLTKPNTPRTTQSMMAIYHQGQAAATKAEKERIFQAHGLHDTEVCLLFTNVVRMRQINYLLSLVEFLLADGKLGPL